MKKLLSLILSLAMIFSVFAISETTAFALHHPDDELDTLDVYGYCNYEKSFECLEYINQYRAEVNASPLTMDKTQLEIAMCRAAECAVFASHSRPNGEPMEGYSKVGYTVYDQVKYEVSYFLQSSTKYLFDENLTLGSPQGAKGAAQSWYNSEGHRATMRDHTLKSTGIACFEYLEFEIWIEIFATFEANEPVSINNYPSSKLRTIKVDVVNNFATEEKSNHSLFVDIIDTEYDEEQYSYQTDYLQNEQDRMVLRIKEGASVHWNTVIIDPSKVKYSTPDTDKISVDSDGTFTVLVNENTTATLCATYQGKTYTKQINIVKQEEEPDIPFDPDDPWNPGCDCEYDNGVITEPADCLYYGEKKYTCKKCGNYYYEYYADPTAHKYKTTVTKASTKKNGSIVTKCTLCDKVISKSTIYYPKTITLSKTSYTYDGKAKKPGVTVKDSNGKTISLKYYTVSYSKGRKNVGKYTVTIKFKGNYSGTIKKTFTIKPKAASISKLTKGKKAFTVKWKKQTQQTTGYQIQYSTSSKFKNAKSVTISKNKTVSKKITKLKAKKKYYVRIRTYKTVKVNGKNVKIYSSWSKAKSVKTK